MVATRSAERIDAVLDEIAPLPKFTEGDEGPFLPGVRGSSDMPPLSGTEFKMKLVTTPPGIALVGEDAHLCRARLFERTSCRLWVDSGDGGQAFHAKTDSESGQSRTAFR